MDNEHVVKDRRDDSQEGGCKISSQLDDRRVPVNSDFWKVYPSKRRDRHEPLESSQPPLANVPGPSRRVEQTMDPFKV